MLRDFHFSLRKVIFFILIIKSVPGHRSRPNGTRAFTIYYCRKRAYFHLLRGLSITLNITCTTSVYGQSVGTLRTPFVYGFQRQCIVMSVQLYINLVKISKCNCTMCIFGEPVGTSPTSFVLRYQRSSIVVCVLSSVQLGSWWNCVWRLSETRQLIRLLSVSGTWGIINSLMWMAALSHRFHASTHCKYAVFCGIGLGDLGGSSSSSWAGNYSRLFTSCLGRVWQLYHPKKWESATGDFIRDTWPFKKILVTEYTTGCNFKKLCIW